MKGQRKEFDGPTQTMEEAERKLSVANNTMTESGQPHILNRHTYSSASIAHDKNMRHLEGVEWWTQKGLRQGAEINETSGKWNPSDLLLGISSDTRQYATCQCSDSDSLFAQDNNSE